MAKESDCDSVLSVSMLVVIMVVEMGWVLKRVVDIVGSTEVLDSQRAQIYFLPLFLKHRFCFSVGNNN